MFRSKYLRKWMIFNLIVSMLPVVTLGIFSYYRSAGSIQNKVNEANVQNLLQTESRLEQVLRTLEYSVTQFGNSPQVAAAMQRSLTLDDFQTINNLTRGLNSLQFYIGIRNVYLIDLEHNWVVSSAGFSTFDALPDHDQFLAYTASDNGLNWITNTADPAGANADTDSGTGSNRYLTLVSKLPFNNVSKHPPGMMVIQISDDELNQFLLSNRNLGENYVFDRDNRLMLGDTTRTDEQKKQIALALERALQSSGTGQGQLETVVGGDRVWLNYNKSSYNRWTYVSVQSVAAMTKDARSIGWFTLAGCLFLFIVMALVTFYGTRKMYSPIRRLFEYTHGFSGSKAETVEQDELAYIEGRIAALLQTGSELENRIVHDSTQLREFFLIKLFRGQWTEAEATEKLKLYHFPARFETLVVLTLQIDSLEGTRFTERDHELLLFAIGNIAGEIIPTEQRFSPILLDDSQVTMLAMESAAEDACRQFAYGMSEKIMETVRRYLQVTVSVGISRPFFRLSEADRAYGEGLAALKHRLRLGSGLILDIDSVQPESRGTEPGMSQALERELLDAVKDGNDKLASYRLHEFMVHLRGQNLPFGEYRMIIAQLLTALTRLVYDWGCSMSSVFGETPLLESFYRLTTAEDAEKWLSQAVIQPLLNYMSNRNETQYNDITDAVIRIIQEEYQTPLSLEACAARIHFHPVYVSRVFKKETGIAFSDYVAQYRLQVAKRWLAETDMRVAEIAEKLTYANSATFIRYFSKAEGMTPGQYRKEMQAVQKE